MASPGLNEITTTTKRSKPMKVEANKAIKDVHKSGTHVPEKDFSSKKKQGAAAGTSGTKKGSISVAKKLGSEKVTSAPEKGAAVHDVPYKEPEGYEGSMKDWSDDHRQARAKGMSAEQWEDSAADRLADNRGEKTLRDDDGDKVHHAPEYKQGVSAFGNSPKKSHGFGHSGAQRQGHLRMSGASGAHQVGKKR